MFQRCTRARSSSLGPRTSGDLNLLPEVAAPLLQTARLIGGPFSFGGLGDLAHRQERGFHTPAPLWDIYRPMKGLSPVLPDQGQDVGGGFGDIGAGAEDRFDTFVVQELVVLRGDDAAADHEDVARPFGMQRLDQFGG